MTNQRHAHPECPNCGLSDAEAIAIIRLRDAASLVAARLAAAGTTSTQTTLRNLHAAITEVDKVFEIR